MNGADPWSFPGHTTAARSPLVPFFGLILTSKGPSAGHPRLSWRAGEGKG